MKNNHAKHKNQANDKLEKTSMYNNITVKPFRTPYGHNEYHLTIDNNPIVEYLEEYISLGLCNELKESGSMLGLYPAWGNDFGEWSGDRKFLWELIVMEESVNLPILVCDDDCDLSCIVIVVAVRKEGKHVFWDRIGLLDHSHQDFEIEKRSGILCIEKYTQDDWVKYGKIVNKLKVDNKRWCKWISENWEEELIRRHRNYTFPYLPNDNNIIWIKNLDFVFRRYEYNNCIKFYKQRL